VFHTLWSPFRSSNLKFPGIHLCITQNTWTGSGLKLGLTVAKFKKNKSEFDALKSAV
jgi:hypothetical protein